MSRTAEYTIKGFIYQFLVTLSKLLDNSNKEVTVEGIIEDVDIVTDTGIEAYQCKYHEAKAKFTLSAIYKPVLQMMIHFKNNPTSKIKYRLHAHFPSETVGSKRKLTDEEVKEILTTTATSLATYVATLSGFTDTSEFINRFEIHFGPSYDDMESSIMVSLAKEGLSTDDVKEIFYPNAVHKIAETSIKRDVNDRKLQKSNFISELRGKKKSAISRWTKELTSYNLILKKRRDQLRDNLNKNLRNRCIIIDANYIDEFDIKIVSFIEDFVNKYNSKVKNSCPTFSLKCSEIQLNQIWKSLKSKNIDVERGKIADEFDVESFLRIPMTNLKESKVEFKVRICNHENDFDEVIKKGKYDDAIIISESQPVILNSISGINIENLETHAMNELRYLLSLNNTL